MDGNASKEQQTVLNILSYLEFWTTWTNPTESPIPVMQMFFYLNRENASE